MLPARPRIRRIPVAPPRNPARALPPMNPPPLPSFRKSEEESGVRLRLPSAIELDITDVEIEE